jgi:dienelactone hydrolase
VCFELDSLPPIPVISGAAVSHQDLVLEAGDSNRFAAFLATPDEPSQTGVMILPDVRGLYHFYEELALRSGESRDGLPGPTQLAGQIEAPVLALQAGADANITPEDNDAFDRALTEAGVEHEVVTYDGAPHSFFDRKQEEFAAASDDAWGRVVEFIQRYARAA